MHRHGFKGRKLGLKRDQRRALLKGLASNLTTHETIETTVAKAKELVPYYEKLVTKAKKGDLHNRRQVIAKMANTASAHKLVDEIAPKLQTRNSGYLRIRKTNERRGDCSLMAKISFVDDLHVKSTTKLKTTATEPTSKESK